MWKILESARWLLLIRVILLSLEGKQNRLVQNFFISKQTEFVFKTQSEIVSVIKKKSKGSPCKYPDRYKGKQK